MTRVIAVNAWLSTWYDNGGELRYVLHIMGENGAQCAIDITADEAERCIEFGVEVTQ